MHVAIAIDPETERVEHFSQAIAVLLVGIKGLTIEETLLLNADGQASDQVMAELANADVLVCSGIDDAEAERISALGVAIAVVRDGTDASDALTAIAHHAHGGGCCGEHGDSDGAEANGGCCGGHGGGCCGEEGNEDGVCCGGGCHEESTDPKASGGCRCGGTGN